MQAMSETSETPWEEGYDALQVTTHKVDPAAIQWPPKATEREKQAIRDFLRPDHIEIHVRCASWDHPQVFCGSTRRLAPDVKDFTDQREFCTALARWSNACSADDHPAYMRSIRADSVPNPTNPAIN